MKKQTETTGSIVSENNLRNVDNATGLIIHKGFSVDDFRQEFVNYAYKIGGMDLVTLVECENGQWDNFLKAYGNEDSWGFCMMNRRWYKRFVDTKEFWEDWRWQLERCNDLLKGGTKFYGPKRIINGIKCKQYVLDRFEILNGN